MLVGVGQMVCEVKSNNSSTRVAVYDQIGKNFQGALRYVDVGYRSITAIGCSVMQCMFNYKSYG